MKMIWFVVFVFYTTMHGVALPEFGVDGLKGLDESQMRKLEDGQIVFTVGGTDSPGHAASLPVGEAISQIDGKQFAFIQAALVMEMTPAKAWEYLYKTEDQYLYMQETESCKVLARSLDEILIEYRVKFLLAGTSFRLIHYFDAENLSMSWNLDSGFDNGFKEFRGFWYLYPFDETRTLARYGNYVSLTGIPDFIVRFFMRNGITRSLGSVRSYVDSAGMYRK